MHAVLPRAADLSDPLAEDFRLAMRRLAGHVAIVAAGAGDTLTGMTVTSVASLSVTPPAVTVSIAKTASLHALLGEGSHFGVSGLTHAHRDLADRFAGRHGLSGPQRFAAGDWRGLHEGAPTLSDAAFALRCTIERIVDWHTHSIVVGRVDGVALGPGDGTDCGGLVYRNGSYAVTDILA